MPPQELLHESNRDLIVQLSADVKNLNQNLGRLANVIEKLEERRIEPVEAEIEELKRWRSEFVGGRKVWDFIVGLISVVSLVIVTILALK